MTEVKITKCPPGKALGADDLQRWAHSRQLGWSGVDGQRVSSWSGWARHDRQKLKRKKHQSIRKERKAGHELPLWPIEKPDPDQRPPWE